jgi:hypothetical protein
VLVCLKAEPSPDRRTETTGPTVTWSKTVSKKDYIALAKLVTELDRLINENMHPTATEVDRRAALRADDFVIPMAHHLKRDNPDFDYARFLTACGVRAEVA